MSDASISYGPEPAQFGILRTPRGSGPHAVVVLIHGGFWSADFGLDLMEPLAVDLVERGYAVWNLEFRRIGDPGGGFPGTFDDVQSGLDHLAELAAEHDLDLSRVGVIGHSSGGHLALWLDGQQTEVRPVLTIGQAAIVDLTLASDQDLGRGAVRAFLQGQPTAAADRFAFAQPIAAPERMVLVHSRDDRVVPFVHAQTSSLPIVTVIDGDHRAHLDPMSEAWAAALGVLDQKLR